jgi:hypothetical protein
MPFRHIFGDLECETGGRSEPTALFAHPKAEGLFGLRRSKPVEPGRTVDAVQSHEEMARSGH